MITSLHPMGAGAHMTSTHLHNSERSRTCYTLYSVQCAPGVIRIRIRNFFFLIFWGGIWGGGVSSTLSNTASSAALSDSTYCVSQKLSKKRTCMQRFLGEFHKNASIVRQNIYQQYLCEKSNPSPLLSKHSSFA